MTGTTITFAERGDKTSIEEGDTFAPKFDDAGLIVCITREWGSNEILMVAWMNREALSLTLQTSIAHYWSRSRNQLWRKGDTSGQTQSVKSIRTDCDQDAILLTVVTGGDGGACHTGRKSCFYREVKTSGETVRLQKIEQ